MKAKARYNGISKKRSFYKIKKHIEIFNRRINSRSTAQNILEINNHLLNQVFKSISTIKERGYEKEDLEIIEYVDNYRTELLSNETVVSFEVFGSKETRKIKDICKISASPKIWGQFLYLLAKNSKSKKTLEIGTNVGISGHYILGGMKQNADKFQFITMEGLDQLCDLTEHKFGKLVDKENYQIIRGLYDNTFSKIADNEKDFDLLFIDGNHQKDSTIEYYNQLKNCISDKAIFIFDDIYYNVEMTEAWDTIKNDASVNFSIDLYKLGIVIIDKSEKKKNISFGVHLSY